MGFKMWIMRLMWRFENSQRMTAVLFWTFTISGVFYNDYIYPNFRSWGIVGPGGGQFTLGFFLTFALVLGLVILIGLAFDKWFKLWRQMVDIRVDRDPYQRGKFYEKERRQWEAFWIVAFECIADGDMERLKNAIERAKGWVERGYVINEEEIDLI